MSRPSSRTRVSIALTPAQARIVDHLTATGCFGATRAETVRLLALRSVQDLYAAHLTSNPKTKTTRGATS